MKRFTLCGSPFCDSCFFDVSDSEFHTVVSLFAWLHLKGFLSDDFFYSFSDVSDDSCLEERS